MNKSIRFFGICLLISSVIVSLAIIYTAKRDRYSIYFPDNHIVTFDRETGNFYYRLVENEKTFYISRNDIKEFFMKTENYNGIWDSTDEENPWDNFSTDKK